MLDYSIVNDSSGRLYAIYIHEDEQTGVSRVSASHQTQPGDNQTWTENEFLVNEGQQILNPKRVQTTNFNGVIQVVVTDSSYGFWYTDNSTGEFAAWSKVTQS